MAITVYRTTDIIPIKLGEVTLHIRPLSADQRAEIQNMTELKSGVYEYAADKMAVAALRYSIRKIEGINFSDGPLEAGFDGELLNQECIDAIFQACTNASLVRAAAELMKRGMDFGSITGIELIEKPSNIPVKKKTKKR